MSLKGKIWIFLLILGLIPILTGCEKYDKKKHVAPPPAPSLPSNLSATAVSFTQINLTWKDNSANEEGFYVYRTTGSNYRKVAILPANTTSYSDSSLTRETTYWYKVTAYNDGGESNSFNEASATTPADIEILDYHIEETYFGYDWLEWETRIVGNVRNNSTLTLTIWMAGRFINYSDIAVDMTYDPLDNVGSGETWRFEIFYLGERIKQVEVWVDDYY